MSKYWVLLLLLAAWWSMCAYAQTPAPTLEEVAAKADKAAQLACRALAVTTNYTSWQNNLAAQVTSISALVQTLNLKVSTVTLLTQLSTNNQTRLQQLEARVLALEKEAK